jgi:putative FmdB family regulatory protein
LFVSSSLCDECDGAAGFAFDLARAVSYLRRDARGGVQMPTYEYHCQKCDHRFELFQSIKEAPKKRCPKCRGKVTRLIGTGAGLLFKGSGFYITDYRSKSYKEAAKKESAPAASTPAKTETKTAHKAESKKT